MEKKNTAAASMLGMWIAIGAGIGVALGNIGAGVGIGVALGAAFAALAAYNQKSKSNITSGPEERSRREDEVIPIQLLIRYFLEWLISTWEQRKRGTTEF